MNLIASSPDAARLLLVILFVGGSFGPTGQVLQSHHVKVDQTWELQP